jgi:hypothetical protein
MAQCNYCNTTLPADHSAVIAQLLEANLDWEKFESDDPRWGYVDDAVIDILGLGNVALVARKLKPETSEMEDGYYSSGEYPQGTTFKTFVVLEYAGRYFKKSGTADSYGDVNWDAGIVKEVQPEIKTVKVWN